ncbi:membrane protein [Rhodopirellula maiorica SM1]|uniref:Membrane protein n=1 Tax=Rhodopirellula maiorica SM1 TaxID=1265738 RepID=M5RQS5_9BACT|nr:hypothetical protein [Rhodopirellula maiorica]EMI21693.1 membrane protein [Rhodopirellula maiorica SM1]
MRKPMFPESRIQRIVTIIGWSLLLLLVVGCGPSGRDLSDAQWLQLQQDIQQERAEIGRQRDLLESDRREWNEREYSEPILAAAITSSVLLACCLLPLLLTACVLRSRESDQDSEAVCDLVIDEVLHLPDVTPSESSPKVDSQNTRRLASRES